MRKPIYLNDNLIIRRKLNFDVNIDKKDIIIGFFLNHEFEYQKTLDEEIKCGNIQKGDKVKDFYNNITYEFLEMAPFSISQENKYMRSSIIEYYLKDIPKDKVLIFKKQKALNIWLKEFIHNEKILKE